MSRNCGISIKVIFERTVTEVITKMEIAAILKNARKSRGLTQQQLADRMGKSQQIIGHWETGYSQPDMSTLFDLFDMYGMSLDETFLNRKNG